jgi:integrase
LFYPPIQDSLTDNVAPLAGQQLRFFQELSSSCLPTLHSGADHTTRVGPELSHPFLYPPQAMAANITAKKPIPLSQLTRAAISRPAVSTSPWLLPLVTLALNTGSRQGELLNLKWEDVNFERGVISVMQTKTLRRKSIAINEATREALNWLNEHRYGGRGFGHGEGFTRAYRY